MTLSIGLFFFLRVVPVSSKMNSPISCRENIYVAAGVLGTKVSAGQGKGYYFRFHLEPLFSIWYPIPTFHSTRAPGSGVSVDQFSLNKLPISCQIREMVFSWFSRMRKRNCAWSNCTSHTHATKPVFSLLTYPCLLWSLTGVSDFWSSQALYSMNCSHFSCALQAPSLQLFQLC